MSTVLLVVVGVLLLGLPLLALLADRVLPPPRNRPVPVVPEDAVRREFALSAAQLEQVERAVRRGCAAPDGLRPAALALAELRLRPATFRGRRLPRLPLPVAAGLAVVVLLGYGLAIGFSRDDPLTAVIYLAIYGGWLGYGVRRRVLLRRAVPANRDGVPAGG